MGVLLSGLLDHLEERTLLLLPVYDERATEDLVPAVLAVDLCEAEHLAVGELASQLLLHAVQVLDLLCREGQTLLLVVGLQVIDHHDGRWLDVGSEHRLVEACV